MRIAITGASGFIGRRLVTALEAGGHDITALGRKPQPWMTGGVRFAAWDPATEPAPLAVIEPDAIIHLAGEPVAQRWTAPAKQRIRDSRVAGTGRLVEAITRMARRPKVLVCASAVGYYGNRGDEILTEHSQPGSGFLAEVCAGWERAARGAEPLGVRVALMRTGLVLGAGGGALEKMLPPFRAGVGGRLGPGSQWMPWIHVDDLAGLYQAAVERDEWAGPINGTAPNPVRNKDFTAALGRVLRRPAILPVPKLALKLLYGEMAEILFHSQRALPEAAVRLGYQFRYPDLPGALRAVLG